MYLSWFDIERKIKRHLIEATDDERKLSEKILSIECFYEVIDVYIDKETPIEIVNTFFKHLFKGWFDEQGVALDISDSKIPLNIIRGEDVPKKSFFPEWKRLLYTEESMIPAFPAESFPHTTVFHSFKGGVGRTLHLAAFVIALTKRSKEIKKPLSIFIIDGDLEAPGITFWQKSKSEVSFIQFLESYHYPPTGNKEDVLKTFAKEIKKTPVVINGTSIYILPAFLDTKDLLDLGVLPEHLANDPANPWEAGIAVKRLGRELGADYIFIDLRAGLSEISSPFIFDRSNELFLVSTLSKQSIEGIVFILGQIQKTRKIDDTLFDPQVILSFMKKEYHDLDDYAKNVQSINDSYNIIYKDDQIVRLDNENIINILETDFHDSLLYVNDWDMAMGKLEGTTINEEAGKWADEKLPELDNRGINMDVQTCLNRLKEKCSEYEYAENAESNKMLNTGFYLNLINKYSDELPNLVSIGAKGSGKTFAFMQIARAKSWNNFLKNINNDFDEKRGNDALVFPLMQSKNLKDTSTRILTGIVESINSGFLHQGVIQNIVKYLKNEKDENGWLNFWFKQMAMSIGLLKKNEKSITIEELNKRISNRETNNKIIFIIDGIEDIFDKILDDNKQQTALKALLDVPNHIRELKNRSIGLVIFLRRDYLKYTIKQNLYQFETRFQDFDLKWDSLSFLRLVFWLCRESNLDLGFMITDINNANKDELLNALIKLWGLKLGKDNSKEATSANWIYGALSDYKGQLQARDIVRFLLHSSDITLTKSAYKEWNDRYLAPSAIRDSIEECSKKKVEETKLENSYFKEWIKDVEKIKPDDKKIPANKKSLKFKSNSALELFKDIGVIYQDDNSDNSDNLYIPEIYRLGLGFILKKGKRPRVLMINKKPF